MLLTCNLTKDVILNIEDTEPHKKNFWSVLHQMHVKSDLPCSWYLGVGSDSTRGDAKRERGREERRN